MRALTQDRMYEVALARRGFGPVAGVDEAGRGACAGPIVISACVMPERPIPELAALTDSKALSARTRERLFPLVLRFATATSTIVIPAPDIDAFGIQHANISGMRRAVEGLDVAPGYVLTDAMRVPGLRAPHLPMIGGDGAARCIAAASVVAKVTRDRIMFDLDGDLPGYGLAAHKGYGTAAHMAAVELLGASREHRMSYANVAAAHGRHRNQRGETPT
ncbi:ribonuclease HII [uncultured Corynebacterium sp.]|uniref:ribonuclease HII n=1 Tax=uncultured Corynebacterium sp. TaxID=159447 RepID=UPI0025F7BF71|nr:ribonuclease HII [uncultured Corynebacterium sp.]